MQQEPHPPISAKRPKIEPYIEAIRPQGETKRDGPELAILSNTPESSRKRPKNHSFFTRFEPPESIIPLKLLKQSIAASSKAESAAPSIEAQLSEAIIAASTKTSGAQNAAGTSFAKYAAGRSVSRSSKTFSIQNGHGSYIALAPQTRKLEEATPTT